MVCGQRRWGFFGGIIALAGLVSKYCAAIEADLQRVYRVPLTDLGQGLTYRRLGVLIAGLPDSDSALGKQMAQDSPKSGGPVDRSGWSLSEQLLAVIASTVATANWQRGGGKGPQPDLFGERRSGGGATQVGGGSQLTDEQIRANLARLAPVREG